MCVVSYKAKAGVGSVDLSDVDLGGCAAMAAPGAVEDARLMAGEERVRVLVERRSVWRRRYVVSVHVDGQMLVVSRYGIR